MKYVQVKIYCGLQLTTEYSAGIFMTAFHFISIMLLTLFLFFPMFLLFNYFLLVGLGCILLPFYFKYSNESGFNTIIEDSAGHLLFIPQNVQKRMNIFTYYLIWLSGFLIGSSWAMVRIEHFLFQVRIEQFHLTFPF